MIKAVLFDIDGVLIDSEEANWKFYSAVFENFNYRVPTREEYKKVHHHTLRNVVKELTKEKNEEKLNKVIEKAVTNPNFFHELWVKPEGLIETIDKLKKKYKLGVVTSRRKIGVANFFRHAGLNEEDFEAIISIDHHKEPKPHPEGLLLAISGLKIRPEEAVYVGDAKTDMMAAKNAGAHFILFPKNPKIKAKKSTDNFSEIPDIVVQI